MVGIRESNDMFMSTCMLVITADAEMVSILQTSGGRDIHLLIFCAS